MQHVCLSVWVALTQKHISRVYCMSLKEQLKALWWCRHYQNVFGSKWRKMMQQVTIFSSISSGTLWELIYRCACEVGNHTDINNKDNNSLSESWWEHSETVLLFSAQLTFICWVALKVKVKFWLGQCSYNLCWQSVPSAAIPSTRLSTEYWGHI